MFWHRKKSAAEVAPKAAEPCPSHTLRHHALLASLGQEEHTQLTAALERCGIQTSTANSEAPAAARNPGVIVIGLGSPDPFGDLARLREMPGWDSSPCIMLVDRCTHQLLSYGLARGVDQFVEGPFDYENIAIRIERLIKQGVKDPFESGSFALR